MLAVLEEHRVAQVLVVARHPEPDGDLEPDGDRAHGPLAAGADVLGRRERGGHDAGAGVQDGRQVGVVVVERVREHPVDEGSLGGRHPDGGADRRGLRVAALVQHVTDDRGAGVEAVGGDAQAEDVQGSLVDAARHLVRHPVLGGVHGEGRELGTEGHPPTTARGRTGDPVAPTRARGDSTNRNSWTEAAASASRSIVSMM